LNFGFVTIVCWFLSFFERYDIFYLHHNVLNDDVIYYNIYLLVMKKTDFQGLFVFHTNLFSFFFKSIEISIFHQKTKILLVPKICGYIFSNKHTKSHSYIVANWHQIE